ncbi:ImmA/IrrE family metallo-endopeptidase [Oculatella sp. LEGE 06141]|uniref:ImmA/IrrE family metallo-endopeptidase n=1 Tax=Oculatella sp. LEGE 06141 TaxID=1828648 RepID=UPI001882A237|nr:ImmA/IrrE family metallo-endopeptidase [Oculatella sp. LEGE 06141]MBE9179965.1 ImmA/IrrE family metallo-endopeptidase [Oculatella sp. LEGE 06141]
MNQVNSARPYRHPGAAFLSHYGTVQSEEDVYQYVEFLRQAAQLDDQPPIDLSPIYLHFGIPTPLRVPLEEQQGILVDSRTGIILIKEDDPIVRQRFTEGHELLELLFDGLDQSSPGTKLPAEIVQRKERLCDQGSADLLMPKSSFMPKVNELGISLNTGRAIATLYQTSLIATLMRMVQYTTNDCALVMWRSALKPSEVKALGNLDVRPHKKLRIWWRLQSAGWTGGFIPKDKSVPSDSLIATVYDTGQSLSDRERMHLGSAVIDCYVEALRLQMGESNCVLSLLHLLND